MERPFTPASNVRFWIVLVVVATIGAAVVGLPMVFAREPIATGQHQAPEQPIPFDHRHHATRDQIDCFYCHPAARTQAKADVPTVERCWGCHQQIWTTSPMLAPVVNAYRNRQPIEWTRVNQLPAFVYFDHAVHIHQGISCFTCHGRVDQMARVQQEVSLLMGWCLDCHRSPERYLRPRELVTATVYEPEQPIAVLGAQLASRYATRKITHCSACHR